MLGSNVPTVGGFHAGFEWGNKWGCECIQIYVTLSRRWDVKDLSEVEISQFQSAWKNSSVKEIVAHLPYLANLASPDRDLRSKARERLVVELDRAEKLDISSLVVHPGSHRGSGEATGIQRIVDGLNMAIDTTSNISTKILLETMAGQGTELGYSFEQLAKILEKIRDQSRFGICFDTCHVFAAGYDIGTYEGYEKTIKQLDRVVGVERVYAFHLNDSKGELGSHLDRHASIGEGQLGLKCFHAIVRDPRFANVPKILEIPERDNKSQCNLDLLRKLRIMTKKEVS